MPQPASPVPAYARLNNVDQQVELLRDGEIAYAIPTTMTVQTDTTVTVTVANKGSLPTDFPTASPSVVVKPVKVGPDVTADLTGDGFGILRIGGDNGIRDLADDSSASWSWEVTPLVGGSRSLYVSLFVRVEGPDGSPVDFRTFKQDVTVKVNPSTAIPDFLKTWGPVSGLTVPVVVGAFVAWIRLRRPKNPPPQPDLAPAADVARQRQRHHPARRTVRQPGRGPLRIVSRRCSERHACGHALTALASQR